jgi:hypothetical protein
LNRTVDLAREAPDAVLFISNHRLLCGVIPSHHVYKTCFNAGFAAGAFFQIDFNVGTHAASKNDLILPPPIDEAPDWSMHANYR